MSSKKRIAIVVAILIGALLVSLAVNLIITLVQKSEHPKKYEEYVEKYASEYNVPEYMLYAVIKTESSFDASKKSEDGKIGLMQMSKETLKLLSSDLHFDKSINENELYDPETAIRYGAYYLRYLFNKYNKWDVALAAYHAGEGTVDSWLNDTAYSKDGETLTKIPDKKTKSYVKSVTNAADYYKNTFYKNGVSVK